MEALLSADELERANAKRNFVSDDVAPLSIQVLKKRVAAILASGDRALMFCYMAAAKQRCRSLRVPMRAYVSAIPR
jgi:hypothetical protein